MSFHIRLARLDDIPAMGAIELDGAIALEEAGVVFSGPAGILPAEVLEACIADNLCLVAVLPDDLPVGFAAAKRMDGLLYIGEVDVLRAHQRQGIG
ncbi:MAG: GNAT family N-acetyltransferase, partial [Bosea sp. (in: a-proteobacteria)]